MKYVLVLLAIFSANTVAQEIVLVKHKDKQYAVVTDCKFRTQPSYARVSKPEVGEPVYMKSRDGRRQKCTVKKAIKIT